MKYENYWKYIERPKRIIEGFFCRNIDNKKLIKRFFEKHKNEIIIEYGFQKLVRLIGVVDGKDDYYYVFQTWNNKNDNYELHSCVGQPIIIKNKIRKWDYLTAEHQFELNGLTVEYGEKIMKEINKRYKSL